MRASMMSVVIALALGCGGVEPPPTDGGSDAGVDAGVQCRDPDVANADDGVNVRVYVRAYACGDFEGAICDSGAQPCQVYRCNCTGSRDDEGALLATGCMGNNCAGEDACTYAGAEDWRTPAWEETCGD